MAILNATVGAGNMRMDELVTALGTGVLPTAKLAGLGIQDVMGALALLKDEGYGAYGAMAQFATALHFFTSPTKKASDAFKQLGLRDLDLADMMRKRGMVATLALLRDRLKLTSDEMARASKTNWAPQTQAERLLGAILPGGRGRVFRVLLNQVDRYQMKLDQINRTTGDFHQSIVDTMNTSAARLHIAWSSVQVDLVRLGDVVRNTLTPIIVGFMGVFDHFLNILIGIPPAIRAIISAWNAVPAPIKAIIALLVIMATEFAIYKAAAIAIEGLSFAWIALRFAIWDAQAASMAFLATNAWLLVIILVIAAIVLLVYKWKWLQRAAVNTWHWIKQAAIDTWSWIKDHWELLLITIGMGFGAMVLAIIKNWHWIKQAAKDTFRWIVGHWRLLAVLFGGPAGLIAVLFANNFHKILRIAEFVFHAIVSHWRTIATLIGGPFARVAQFIISNWHSIKNAAVGAWDATINAARDAVNWLKRAWSQIRGNGLVKLLLRGGGIIGAGAKGTIHGLGVAANAANSFLGGYTGGRVTGGGIMDVGEHGRERIYVPTGSFIRPAGFRSMPGGTAVAAGAGDVLEVHVHSYLDGKEVSENVSKHMANKKARK
jgi:hypothetical protein